MKRPITLLCLSDLHLVPEGDGNTALTQLIKKINSYKTKDFKWIPDYIVVAGDLVDGREKEYHVASGFIDSIINTPDFSIPPFNVITVPGNHDKDFPDSSRKNFRIKEKKKNKVLSDAINASVFSFDLKENYANNFKSYGGFYHRYVNVGDQDASRCEYEYATKFLGSELEDIALTSGLKVFHDTKTCFLTVNTEWGYVPDHKGKQYSQIRLCTPVVYESINKYLKNYSDYLLVTVMHRNPIELSRDEQFRLDPHKPDILQYIYHYSDILLSGHDHIEKVISPNMLMNKVQHFQLGSASMNSRNNELVQFCAALIYVDPIRKRLELLNLKYDYQERVWNDSRGGVFKLAEREGDFVDYSKHVDDVKFHAEITRKIPVKSMSKEDIENAAKVLFPERTDMHFSLLCVNVWDSDPLGTIKRFVLKESKAMVVVYSDNLADHPKCQNFIRDAFNDNNIRMQYYLKKLIIVEIFVEVVNPPLSE